MEFFSSNKRFGLDIRDCFIQEIVDFIGKARTIETGGILIGCYSENLSCAIVKKITGAPPDSKSGRTWFYRGFKGLKELLDSLWKKNYYYIGEWHFHPNAEPSPSFQDWSQMSNIAKAQNYNCPEPILLIIGGNRHSYKIRVFVSVKGKRIELLESVPN